MNKIGGFTGVLLATAAVVDFNGCSAKHSPDPFNNIGKKYSSNISKTIGINSNREFTFDNGTLYVHGKPNHVGIAVNHISDKVVYTLGGSYVKDPRGTQVSVGTGFYKEFNNGHLGGYYLYSEFSGKNGNTNSTKKEVGINAGGQGKNFGGGLGANYAKIDYSNAEIKHNYVVGFDGYISYVPNSGDYRLGGSINYKKVAKQEDFKVRANIEWPIGKEDSKPEYTSVGEKYIKDKITPTIIDSNMVEKQVKPKINENQETNNKAKLLVEISKLTPNSVEFRIECADKDGLKKVEIINSVDNVILKSHNLSNYTEVVKFMGIEKLKPNTKYTFIIKLISENLKTGKLEETEKSITFTTCKEGEKPTPPTPEKPDTTPPEITLNGPSTMTLTVGDTYTELGATAIDDRDGEVVVYKTGEVDTSKKGTYYITYTATDKAGNNANEERMVIVKEKDAPNEAPKINQTRFNGEFAKSKTFYNVVSDDGALSNITMTASPNKGTLVYNGDGSITYTIDAGKAGDDVFNVTFSDGEKETSSSMTFTGFDGL